MKKRVKKSSIALLLMFGLLISGVSVYAANEFEFTLALPIYDYKLSSQNKTTTTSSSGYSYFELTYSQCPAAYTSFWVEYHINDEIASETLYLPNTDLNGKLIEYKDEYKTVKGYMNLMAHTSSQHTGYEIKGIWNANLN